MSKYLVREDIDRFFEFDILVPERILYIGSAPGEDGIEGGTDYQMAESTVKALVVLEAKNKNPITIKMNNLGGDEYHGLAIYDAIRMCESRVTVEVYGHAMSMGSWILQAADKRLLSPSSTVMIHYGTWGTYDHWAHAKAFMQEGERLNTLMRSHYLERIREKHPRYTDKQLDKLLKTETYLPAKEAVELGLADRTLEFPPR